LAQARHPGTLKAEKTLDEATAAAKTELKPELTVSVSGTSYTVSALIAKLESYQALFGGTRDAREALHEQILKRDQILPEVIAFLGSLKGVLVGLFGADSAELQKFGFAARKKRAPLTAEQLLARATKAKATRAKRNTMGKKQKASVKAVGTPIISASMPTTKPSATSPSDAADAGAVSSGVASEGSSSSSSSPTSTAPVSGDASPTPVLPTPVAAAASATPAPPAAASK